MTLGSNFRRAGRRLGLDLEGLFKDDETLNMDMVNDFSPELRRAVVERGRGRALTMKPQQADPILTELTLKPGQFSQGSGSQMPDINITNENKPQFTNTVTGGFAMPMPPVVEEKSPYTWRDNRKLGGFGTADYQAALAEGYTNEDIKDFLTSNPAAFGGSGLNVGEDVRMALGLSDSYQSDLAKIASGKADQVKATAQNWRELTKTRGGIGAAAVNAALQGGAALADIEAYAKAYGLKVGEKAAQLSPELAALRQSQTGGGGGGGRSRGPSGGYQGSVEQVGKVGAKGGYQKQSGSIGAAGIQRAAAAMGISPREAAQRAQAQGTTLGPAAQALLG